MADISAIKLPDGITYDIKDKTKVDDSSTFVTPSITNGGTGTLVSALMAKHGRVRTLQLVVKKSSSTAAGSNVYVGTLNTDAPLVTCYGVGYYASSCCILQLQGTGAITVRVTGAQLAANAETFVSITYIV